MNSNGSHRISGLSPTDSGCSHYFHSVVIGKINGLVANFNGVESSSPLPRIGEGVEQTQIVTDLERLKSTVIMRQNLYSPTRHCCTCL